MFQRELSYEYFQRDFFLLVRLKLVANFYMLTITHDAAGKTWDYSFQGPVPQCENTCQFSIVVLKCKYCANERDSIHTLSAEFGRHWTQIWSSNPQILSPDTLGVGQLLALGNSYRLQNGDTWTSVAVRFGTTVSLLQQLNPDFANPSDPTSIVDSPALYSLSISLNSTMCIMPETCAAYRPVVPSISW